MNSDNNSSINWLKIIFDKEFQQYLNIDILNELSLVSKIARVKLNPKVFYAIKIENNYRYIGRKRVESYNFRGLNKLNKLISSNEEELKKGLYAEKELSDIKFELENIKELVSSLYLENLDSFGYYLVPMFENFFDLKILKLYHCTIPYSLLVNLGVSFPKLKALELSDLLLVKLSTDVASPSDFNFPPNLIYLKFGEGKIIEQGALSNPYEILFKNFSHEPSHMFKLPKIPIPSLKRLDFIYSSGLDRDLLEFLDLNTSLESLKTRLLNLDRVYNFESLKRLEVECVCLSGSGLVLPTQKSIKELTAKISLKGEFERVKKLCNLCPNLEKLQIIMPRIRYEDGPQEQFNTFLIPALSKLLKLKTLVINTDINEGDIIDINEIPHVENIVFEIYNPLLNFKFNNCIDLKSIEIKCKWFEPDSKKFLDEFNKMCSTHSNWILKFTKDKIKGYKDY
ncbi:hypothetical protein CONCODRAFT_11496 [Conidiobolus coronatus NRRL 28638]|uniref:F-box domain-containing protein n=1 Tax=Conidiobolus coronatus (strain ATCC 28846 / CBS 209.66 / NRRL 28638) TaxID=796925 RepID=A0A137NUX4_CONC2|nr:hypothetical protein CONCODRAFT_11496 [Conidiobolus coronatus NRRL 28638]|eukprot:KXN66613.1 hypothetical protein CONCODRAFT_11496 [Conidiobolus coronatus NRRL 28638]